MIVNRKKDIGSDVGTIMSWMYGRKDRVSLRVFLPKLNVRQRVDFCIIFHSDYAGKLVHLTYS